MARNKKLQLEEYQRIQKEFNKFYKEERFQYKKCLEKLSEKYFKTEGTIQKILQKDLAPLEKEVSNQPELF